MQKCGKKINITKRGFTLIEMLIYVFLLIIMSALVINTVLIMSKSFGSLKSTRRINNAAEVAMERMIREIRLADSINDAESVFGVSPGKLVLNSIDPFTEASTTIEFSVTGNTLNVIRGGGLAVTLISNSVKINNFVVRELNNSTISKAIKIDLDLESGEGASLKTSKFYSTAVLRRSY